MPLRSGGSFGWCGGVCTERMSYKDATQQLEIDLDPGWQTLNGNQAQQFKIRNSEMGDVAGVQRQQALLKALRARLTSLAVVPYLPKLTRIMPHVDTNLSPAEMLALVNFCTGLEQENFQMVLLPGSLSPGSQQLLARSGWARFDHGQVFWGELSWCATKMRPLSTLRIAIQMPLVSLN